MRFLGTLVAVMMAMGWLAFTPIAPAHAATSGDLVTCPDFSSVYYLADDGSRWVFPNEKTYFTWFDNFNSVIEITCPELATYPIGEVVTYQPGTRLVKIQSINKVYAVELGGNLRWVQTEAGAEELFGSNWADRIDDVPDGFWSSYTEGSALSEHTFPAGSLLISGGTGFYYYVESLTQVGQELLTDVQQNYAIEVPENFIQTYKNGGSYNSGEWNDTKALDRETDANADELPFNEGELDDEEAEEEDTPDEPLLADPGGDIWSGDYYSVEWTEVAGATSYTLEEDTSSDFSSPSVVYEGTATNTGFVKYVKISTTYHYRVKALEGSTEGDWSNVEEITVHPYMKMTRKVPNGVQPPPNTLASANVGNWCTPLATANVLEYWEDANEDYTNGVTAGNNEAVISDYLGWFMDTNNVGSTARGNSGMSGTIHWDIFPGLDEFLTWGGNDPSDYGFSVPANLAGKTSYNNWGAEEHFWSDTSDEDAWDHAVDAVDDEHPLVMAFTYWNPRDLGVNEEAPDGETVHFYGWGPSISNSGDATMEAPYEVWASGDVGHAVTVVGYLIGYDAGDGNGEQDWVIVHDTWDSTPENVAVPFANWEYSLELWPEENDVPPQVENVVVTDPVLQHMAFTVNWSPVPEAKNYEIRYRWDEGDGTTYSSFTAEGDNTGEHLMQINDFPYLGSDLIFQVRGVNDEGEGDWSSEVQVEALMIM